MSLFRVLEIGGTQIRRADVSTDFEVTSIITDNTAKVLSGNILADLKKFARDKINSETEGIIVLAAGPIEDRSIIKELPNFPNFPKNTNLKNLLSDSDLPLFVYNDMEAAVSGMAYLGKFKSPFWGLTWSTGLGGKYWDGQKITVNEEIGHINFAPQAEDALCGCGAINHAESFLGGKNMAKEIGQNLQAVTDAYESGESWAKNFYHQKARIMGKYLAKLDEIAPSETFIFKGSVALNLLKHSDINNEIKKSFQAEAQKEIELMISPDPEKDSLIGAVILTKTN